MLACAFTSAVNARRGIPQGPEIVYRTSKYVIFCAVAICVLPPLIALLVFWENPQWHGPLISILLISLCLGPVLLLRRYARYADDESEKDPGAAANRP